jgi:hypothetical protein
MIEVKMCSKAGLDIKKLCPKVRSAKNGVKKPCARSKSSIFCVGAKKLIASGRRQTVSVVDGQYFHLNHFEKPPSQVSFQAQCMACVQE